MMLAPDVLKQVLSCIEVVRGPLAGVTSGVMTISAMDS